MYEQQFYLLDLERTILSKHHLFFWKSNKHGYTTILKEAGLFDESKANEIVDSDFDKKTVMISQEVIQNILKKF